MLEQDPVEGRQRETKVEIMTKQDPIQKGDKGIMLEQDLVEGRQRETKVEIMTKQDRVEGRQRWKSCWNRIQ